MSVKKLRYLRANRINKKKILILSILFFSVIFISFINDLNINKIFNQNEQSYKDLGFQNLNTQALSLIIIITCNNYFMSYSNYNKLDILLILSK